MKLSSEKYKELENIVYNYPTKNKEGFVAEEEKQLLESFSDINMSKYYDVLTGITGIMDDDGNFVTYHCDILQALVCGLENRKQTLEEWD